MSGGPLTRRDFDEVMRRAAELAGADPGADGAEPLFSDAEVVRIGKEAGLAEHHVRRALADFRAAGRPRSGGRRGVGALLGPGTIRTSRTVGRSRRRIARELDEFLVAGQLLQPVRRKDDLLQYRPAIDWASRVARAASATSRQHYVAAARLVEVRLAETSEAEPAESKTGKDDHDGTAVTVIEFFVDPGIIKNYQSGAVLGGGGAGAAVGTAVALGAIALFPLAVAVAAGVVAGAATALAVAALVAKGFRKRLDEVESEVEGILDGVEGGLGLEPPPPAWRRWVRRHFHGVAREVIGRK